MSALFAWLLANPILALAGAGLAVLAGYGIKVKWLKRKLSVTAQVAEKQKTIAQIRAIMADTKRDRAAKETAIKQAEASHTEAQAAGERAADAAADRKWIEEKYPPVKK